MSDKIGQIVLLLHTKSKETKAPSFGCRQATNNLKSHVRVERSDRFLIVCNHSVPALLLVFHFPLLTGERNPNPSNP